MKLLFAIVILCSSFLSSQVPHSNDRTIEVKGVGEYKTMPDLAVLVIEASVLHPSFGDAVKLITAKVDQLTAQLQTVGFKKEQIKTTDFSVTKHIEWENNKNIEKGYMARQNISVEFPHTKEKIGAVVTSFMSSKNDIHFSFHFKLSDEKEKQVKDETLKRAIADAQSRAELIVAAANQKLGEIKHILYGKKFQTPGIPRAAIYSAKMEPEQPFGFDVKEIVVSDEVTIIWNLK